MREVSRSLAGEIIKVVYQHRTLTSSQEKGARKKCEEIRSKISKNQTTKEWIKNDSHKVPKSSQPGGQTASKRGGKGGGGILEPRKGVREDNESPEPPESLIIVGKQKGTCFLMHW